ncbi:hypothetical protein [Longimicrobium sp.]|uniref:hypothetical protein n=1 Tax=Longimicrobium sp. TaxID=2029185 RepID=UPI002E329811|nr:hypothetical protein [Longimicrobium sp.]HEX6041110.1 hypothetical protein [Longimicrobium sp.]
MRILVWNIQFFTSARVTPQGGGTLAETLANAASAQANLAYITSTVAAADADVFVILETLSSQGAIGTLADGGGPDGVLSVLAGLRILSNQWMAVPPLRVNPREVLADRTYTESVGVFWRDDRVRFDGPMAWPAAPGTNATGPAIVPGTAAAGAYPAPWAAAVPGGTTAAPQVRFFSGGGQEILFTDNNHRRLYLTTFTERGGAQRLVRLFSMHTKPGITARTAVARLTSLQAGDWVPGANEVTVFAGDFNLNLRALTNLESAAINMLTWDDLRRIAISPTPAANPPTRFRARAAATAGNYLTDQLFDWALVRYGAGAAPAPAIPMLVGERVVGVAPGGGLPTLASDMATPLATITAPRVLGPLGALRIGGTAWYVTQTPHGLEAGDPVTVAGVTDPSFNGTFPVASVTSGTQFTVAQPGPDTWRGMGSVVSADAEVRLFRRMENFGHLGPPAQNVGTSDHLPIFFIV